MDRMTQEVIRDEETKAPFARIQSLCCAWRDNRMIEQL